MKSARMNAEADKTKETPGSGGGRISNLSFERRGLHTWQVKRGEGGERRKGEPTMTPPQPVNIRLYNGLANIVGNAVDKVDIRNRALNDLDP